MKITHQKQDLSTVKSKCGTMSNLKHTPRGGEKKVCEAHPEGNGRKGMWSNPRGERTKRYLKHTPSGGHKSHVEQTPKCGEIHPFLKWWQRGELSLIFRKDVEEDWDAEDIYKSAIQKAKLKLTLTVFHWKIITLFKMKKMTNLSYSFLL